jgi:hypothetical protein
MALGKHDVRNIAVILGVVVVAAILIAVFVLPASPHFGFVSEQQTNNITHKNLTSSHSSSSTSSNSSSGERRAGSVEYYEGTQSVTISVVEYNSSAMAAKAYGNFTQLLGSSISASLNFITFHNSTYKSFKIVYGYINAPLLLNYNLLLAAGLDGSYFFLIYGLLTSGNNTEISALADAQASAML